MPSVDAVPSTSANVVAGPATLKGLVGSTKVSTQRGEQVARSRLPARLQGATGRASPTLRTPEPADVRGAAQRPVVDVFSFSPFAYRVQGSTEPTGALCPHRRPSGRGAQESLRLQVDEVRESRPPTWSTRCACRLCSPAKHPRSTKPTRHEPPQRQHEGQRSTERTKTTECARIPPRPDNPHQTVRIVGHKGAGFARPVR